MGNAQHMETELTSTDISALVPMTCCAYHRTIWDNAFQTLGLWWEHNKRLFSNASLDIALSGEYSELVETLFMAFFQISAISVDAELGMMISRVAELTGNTISTEPVAVNITRLPSSKYDN